MPLALAVAQNARWSRDHRTILACVSSLAAGVLTAYVQGHLTDPVDAVQTVAIVLAASKVTYDVWWKPSGLVPALERVTTARVADDVER